MRARVRSRFGSFSLLPTKFLTSFALASLRAGFPRIRRCFALSLATIALPALAQTLTPAPMPSVGTFTSETGATSGAFTVDKTGAARYSIPIFAVPGTAGVTPKLSIDYVSDGGNGLLGQGWSIGGLSEITRCHQNKLQDAQNLPIKWDANDRYCLDGQRLIAVGTNQYKKEIFDGDFIYAFGGVAGTPDYFRVDHKDGSHSFYGNAPTPRDPNSQSPLANSTAADGKIYSGNDTTKVLTWRLRKYQDIAGNPIWYQYQTGSGYVPGFTVAEVRYGYGANNGPDNYGARIYFNYSLRPDFFDRGFVGGLNGLDNVWRVQNIISENAGTTVRTYNLSYLEQYGDAYTGPSHLSSLQECGVGGVCRPATTFTWQLPTVAGLGPSIQVASPISNRYPTAYGDINGDGCADAVFPSTFAYAFGNCQGGSYSLSSLVAFSNGATSVSVPNSNGLATVADLNRDGHADIVLFDTSSTTNRYLHIFYSQLQSDGSWKLSSTPVNILMAPKETSTTKPTYVTQPFIADINGDGLMDIVYGSLSLGSNSAYYNGIGVRYGQADGTFGNETIIPDSCGLPHAYDAFKVSLIGDLNGDGQPDLEINMTSGSQVFQAFEVFSGTASPTLTCRLSRIDANNWTTLFPIDVNGDGLVDLDINDMTAYWTSGGNITHSFQLNTGVGFGSAQVYQSGAIGSYAAVVSDQNRDGYADLAVAINSNSPQIRLWNPSAQSFNTTVAANSYAGIGTDLNGDGLPDTINNSLPIVVQLSLGGGLLPNVITKITDGLGAVTNINYENTQASTHYQKLHVGLPSAAYPDTFKWGNSGSYSMGTPADFYTALNQPFDLWDGYIQRLGQEAPVSELSGPKWVVASVDQSMPSTTSTAIGNVNGSAMHTTSYYYGEGKVENSIRGLLGFHTIEVIDQGTGLKTITRYRQDFPFIGKPITEDVFTSTNQKVSSKMFWWAFQNWGSTLTAPYLVTPEPAVINSYKYNPDVAGNPLVVYENITNTFDANLNLVTSQVDTKADTAQSTSIAESVLTTYTYPTDNRGYLGLPSQITVQSSRPSQTTLTLTRTYGFNYYCFDASPCPATNMSGLLYQKIVEPNKTAYNVTTQYNYDTVTGTKTQEVISGVDIVNRTTTWGYDSLFRFVNTTTNGLNQVTSNVVSRNALGEPTQINGLNGASVQYVYTPLGRQYLEYHNDGHYTRVSRAMAAKPNGQAMTDTILHENGALEAVGYDMLGRVIGKEILLPGYLQFGWSDTEYDPAGRVRHTSEPYIYGSAPSSVVFTETNYDAVGRVSSVKAPDGGVTTTTYNGLTTTITDPAGHAKVEVRDLMGEVSTVTDALNGTVQYAYDVEGHPLTVTTSGPTQATGVPSSIAVNYTYDDVGRKKTMSDPDKGAWSYTYDVLGELLTQTDAKGQVISIPASTSTTASGYDALGRVLARTDKKNGGATEETTTWTYDSAPNGVGEIASVQQANSHYLRTYNYDSLGRENGQSISLTSEGVQYNIARYYDQYGREYQTFDASGNGIQRYYNTQGYFYKASDLSSNFTVGSQLYVVLSLDAAARVTSDGLGLASNGTSPLITRTYVYDAMGRPTSIQSNSGVALQNLNYSYYGVGSNQYGNMSQRQDVTKGLTETFNYDALNRLTSSQVTNQAAVTVSYDSFGNIISKSDRGTYSYATNAGPHAVTSVAGVANTYDANGNYSGTGSTRVVSYNTFDKPTTVFGGGAPLSAFTYGPDRDYYKRLEFSGGTTTETLYLDGVERVYNLSAGTRMDRRYLPGGAYRINNYTGVTSYNVTTSPGTLQSTTVEYLLDDHQGSTDVIADANGNVKQAMSFDAWGMRRNPSTWVTLTTAAGFDNSQTSHGYTGHEMVDNANIIHMHGRIYDPRWGRMLQADPYIEEAPSWMVGAQGLISTQTQNRYAYVDNNPLIHTDPTGYCTFADIGVCKGFSTAANGAEGWFPASDSTTTTTVSYSFGGFSGSFSYTVNGSFDNSGISQGGSAEALKNPSSILTLTDAPKGIAGMTLAVENVPTVWGRYDPLAEFNKANRLFNWENAARVYEALRNARGAIPFIGVLMTPQGAAAAVTTLMSSSTAGPADDETQHGEADSGDGKKDTLKPGPHAGDSVPARGPGRDFTPGERDKINDIGKTTGCHTCGTTEPGTKSGNFVPDHQPPNALNPTGEAQDLYPHCIGCSRTQGGQVRGKQYGE